MAKTKHGGMIIENTRFPRSEFPEASSGQAGAGYMAFKKQIINR